MQHFNDPRQNRLFDVYEDILSPLAHKQLLGGWQHVFRETILRLMPVDTVKGHFDPVFGHRQGHRAAGRVERAAGGPGCRGGYPRHRNQRKPRQQTVLTRLSELQERLVSILGLKREKHHALG